MQGGGPGATCGQCGTACGDQSTCPVCGEAVRQAPLPTPTVPVHPRIPAAPDHQANRTAPAPSRSRLTVIVAAVVVLGFAGAVLAYVVTDRSTDPGRTAIAPESGGASTPTSTPSTTTQVVTTTGSPIGAAGTYLATDTYLCVTGVADDDVLHLRADHDPSSPSIAELPPRACDIFPTGHVFESGDSHWVEVTYFDHVATFTGWANADYLVERTNPCSIDSNQCGL